MGNEFLSYYGIPNVMFCRGDRMVVMRIYWMLTSVLLAGCPARSGTVQDLSAPEDFGSRGRDLSGSRSDLGPVELSGVDMAICPGDTPGRVVCGASRDCVSGDACQGCADDGGLTCEKCADGGQCVISAESCGAYPAVGCDDWTDCPAGLLCAGKPNSTYCFSPPDHMLHHAGPGWERYVCFSDCDCRFIVWQPRCSAGACGCSKDSDCPAKWPICNAVYNACTDFQGL
jgi:hypothetical protein